MTPKIQSVARVLLGLGAAIWLGSAAAPGQTHSHARVVRLGFVEGQVTVQRPGDTDWTEAPMNTPLEEGFKLSTAEGSFAEVEFENDSTARLGQSSLLEFTQLALAPDGSKIDHLTLNAGYATFSVAPEGQDTYEIATADTTLTPRGKSLFRVDVDSSEERVEVFNGFVDVSSALGSWSLAKDSVLDLSPGAEQPAQISEGITKDDWDHWVRDRENQAQAASSALSPSGYTSDGSDDVYGWADLANYGNWSDISGYGYGWVPTVDAGWYPFSQGLWCWYPGYGYVWISGEPWGWLPYHFGGWEFIPGMGWVWFPGNFGPWSPGSVNWYGGPGWIGWTPRHGLPRPGSPNPCPQGRTCGTAISVGSFKRGRPVHPGTTLQVTLTSGNRIEKPDIPPAREALHPGRVVASPSQVTNAKVSIAGPRSASFGPPGTSTKSPAPGPDSVAGITVILGSSTTGSPARHAAPGPHAGIVYDPATGRYVNNPRPSSAATPGTDGVPARPVYSVQGGGASQTGQPAPGSQMGRPSPSSDGSAWRPQSSPGSGSGSAEPPRTGGATTSGRSTGGNAPSGGGAKTGSTGGGGTGGGSHSGGGGSGGSPHPSGGGSAGGGHH
ncbi:MAG: DUF6600 domain-containing protein [Terriglobia bacterium]|jgi:uncharacterized protein DUF6600/FecR-like protein